MPVTQEALDDSIGLRWSFEAALDRLAVSLNGDARYLILTDEEKLTGYREFTSSDGVTGQYAVGWRAEQEQAEADARREAEMAACPFVECTCGWHDED